ncbi:DNA-directed RNA polymerase subunit H [Candidatus Methanosphaera massiliense]|uniref:DNA-directed RNA polymerase subunit H n=1 Tax=Methanosphaera TaxID=2316 RepID=UPI000DC2C569|nr:DNA-directed RNA polymerase subunit H [Candidatus Methanosphaera massiliense]MDD6286061.1 DNA-directed RNA polymerase subunit H [Methanobacteriaceae archaeon]MDE4077774.1 DNA-directed RNA polymerase subunit H [Candidatus Methanosphaera massiliense]MDY2744785.1 DNA-directed RNA polymerase subunit H [Methanosphaera sp.]RAP43820.1 MAG: DNA-directed RNA polymerase subunit H [Methanosphaera sp. SHI1033]
MKVDILQHNLVPEHTILSDEEAEEVLDKLNVRVDQIPKILPTDPVVKAIGAELGDIIKITRKSETAGIFVAYRVVRE